ncbi:hypothetical protein CYMTET_26190 [Cymbomonas tetramitiformis]|uniref:Lipid IV(A) 3-deoxy-D-manno-octulosonic acid transferase n=1 Tax=Cymbomonas tetramitiformis TaxID=36881 RepID=A0AAE0FSU4_9CHLO|nr:hypothetical protein CYMTET_26190 [Cymbomonas tetramitiformis]
MQLAYGPIPNSRASPSRTSVEPDPRLHPSDPGFSQSGRRRCWVAGSIHPGEEGAILHAHIQLSQQFPDLLTVIVPRQIETATNILEMVEARGVPALVMTRASQPIRDARICIVATIGDLPSIYSECPISYVGNSLLPDGMGHNLAEPAYASSAVVCGPNLGPFQEMADEMQGKSGDKAVLQVADSSELVEAVRYLLANPDELKRRQVAAKDAVNAVSEDILNTVWSQVKERVIEPALEPLGCSAAIKQEEMLANPLGDYLLQMLDAHHDRWGKVYRFQPGSNV